ncbi:MAG: 3-phosphoshikimate 1-carboxyvinyltransferase [Dehalococcoidia bacterium]
MTLPLPAELEIVPLSSPVHAEVVIPGSKSITNRALVAAALADGVTTVTGALWSDDTQVMVDCLRRLDFDVSVEDDPEEPANRTIGVTGRGGRLAAGGTASRPLDLFVGNAGTAARFLAAMVALGHGAYRLYGVPRMHERPQASLFAALRQLGYRVDDSDGRLPAVIHGTGPRPGHCDVSVDESSQFASALLLSARRGSWDIRVTGGDAEELPYVTMTRNLVEAFPAAGGAFAIEPDASSASYFVGAGHLLAAGGSRVSVKGFPASGWQIDADLPRYLPLPAELSRDKHLGDAIMTAIVLAPFADHPVRFTDLGRLRVQECERVFALRSGLERMGARVEEEGDTLTISPSSLHGAEIETYDDHRVAMCFAMLGLVVEGVRVKDPGCVAKTFPNFFAKLAAPPPSGLGATLLDGLGRELRAADLG